MKTMTVPSRRARLCALLFPLALCLTACAAPQAQDGALAGFSRDNAFCYPDLQWGMTPSEVQEKAGGLAAQPDGSGDPGDSLDSLTGALFSKETVALSGLTARASFQFEDGSLWAAGLTASDGATQEAFDALVQEARDAFGAETQAHENETRELEWNGTSMTVTVSSYQWDLEDENGAQTRLMLSSIQQSESIVSVSLDVSLLPNA